MPGTLYLVATPIGNLEDLSDRARRVLGSVDLIAAEDTRRTGRLLKAIGVQASMVSFFQANEEGRGPAIVRALREGRDVAVVTDAGMPGVSDPGYRLVTLCLDEGIAVDVIPGPSAAIAALVISGLPTDRFAFEGFLPRGGRARRQRLDALASDPRTIVLFESPRRTETTLGDLLASCGDRRVAVARELTKLHQEVIRGRLSEVGERLRGRELKGEVAVVLEGASAPSPEEVLPEAVRLAARLVAEGRSKKEASRAAHQRSGVATREIYRALVDGSEGGYSAEAGSTRVPGGRRADSSE